MRLRQASHYRGSRSMTWRLDMHEPGHRETNVGIKAQR